MPSVTGYTTAKIDALIADAVVSGDIDSGTGNLTLTTHDGTILTVGSITSGIADASTTGKGVVELATDVETQAGTDTARAVTPFGMAAVVASATGRGLVELATSAETLTGTDTTRAVTPAGLASLPAVKAVSGIAESATPTSYPSGISMMTLSASSWSLNSGTGTVVTTNPATSNTVQKFFTNNGTGKYAREWTRQYNSTDGGWSPWAEVLLMVTLTPGSFTQTTAFTSYPQGWSRLYYTSSNSTSWDFTGNYGEVLTFRDGTDFAKQEFTLHANGSSTIPYTIRWMRTANGSGGWTNWLVVGSERVVGRHTRSATALGSVGATEVGFIRIDNIPVKAGYSYEVIMPRCIITTTATTTNGIARIRGSQSGNATVTSNQLEGAEIRSAVAVDTSNVPEQVLMGWWDATTSGTLSIIITVQRASGSGSVGLYSTVGTVTIPVRVKEVGPTMPDANGTDL